eukprot:1822613-Rhodomonas_salina.1
MRAVDTGMGRGCAQYGGTAAGARHTRGAKSNANTRIPGTKCTAKGVDFAKEAVGTWGVCCEV